VSLKITIIVSGETKEERIKEALEELTAGLNEKDKDSRGSGIVLPRLPRED
jgi:hypothetical protein